jgi:hypothetical protein
MPRPAVATLLALTGGAIARSVNLGRRSAGYRFANSATTPTVERLSRVIEPVVAATSGAGGVRAVGPRALRPRHGKRRP